MKTIELPRASLCGFQPSGDGRLHIGNLLGSAAPFAKACGGYDENFCMVADLHALSTGEPDPQLKKARLRCAKELLAIVPESACVFFQSDVPEICSVYALLTMIVPLGDLRRMTQFEQKGALYDNPSSGLLLYPALMAADVLSLQAADILVGADQIQHAELARTLRDKIAARGARLAAPNAVIPAGAARVKSLQEPDKKMSKSDPNGKSCIYLDDPESEIRLKIKRAVSDPLPIEPGPGGFASLESRPGLANMVEIFCGLRQCSPQEAYASLAGGGFARAKSVLADQACETLTPLRSAFTSISDRQALLRLEDGARRARLRAGATLELIRGCFF